MVQKSLKLTAFNLRNRTDSIVLVISGVVSALLFAFDYDGVNDAPVVSLESTGIVMGGLGNNATMETAYVGVAILAILNAVRIQKVKG